MKSTTTVIGFVLILVTSTVQAIPTPFFNGGITFNSSASKLSVTSDLTGAYDITPVPELIGNIIMSGADATNTGIITDNLMPGSGSLTVQFSSGQSAALQSSVSKSFSDIMFKDSFDGSTGGHIRGESVAVATVVEPSFREFLFIIGILGFALIKDIFGVKNCN